MILEKTLPQTRERNWGVDMLRIVAMLMVVMLHILGPGGILFEADKQSAIFSAAWFVEMMFFCAINCYGLISGYVGVGAKYKYSNLAYIWLQVVAYSVGITLFFHLRYPDVIPFKNVIESFFPVCNGYYWYFTAYFGMFIFAPVLNAAVNTLKKHELRAMLVCTFIILCVLPSHFKEDIFLTGWGYSTIWLCFLYLTGGYVKRHGFFKNRIWFCIVLYWVNVLLTWGVKLWEEYVSPSAYWADLSGGLLTQYSSPTVFLSGLALFVIFTQLKFPSLINKLIALISPLTFGVYIIHAHPLMWDRVITYKYAHYINFSVPGMIGAVVLTGICLFAVLAAADAVRLGVFKLLKIKPLLQKIETKLKKE